MQEAKAWTRIGDGRQMEVAPYHDDKRARTLAEEALRAGADFDGVERSPMRNAEGRVTLRVPAAPEGDLGQALIHGE